MIGFRQVELLRTPKFILIYTGFFIRILKIDVSLQLLLTFLLFLTIDLLFSNQNLSLIFYKKNVYININL